MTSFWYLKYSLFYAKELSHILITCQCDLVNKRLEVCISQKSSHQQSNPMSFSFLIEYINYIRSISNFIIVFITSEYCREIVFYIMNLFIHIVFVVIAISYVISIKLIITFPLTDFFNQD
jgi:ribosomal protein S3AE